MIRVRRIAASGTVLLMIGAGAGVSACQPTTYDASATVPTTGLAGASTTTSLAWSAVPAEVLPEMLTEVADLARRVAEGDGDGDAAARIEQMWAAISVAVAAERPELVEDFDFVVRRCRDAADRDRPADADRAFKNLQALVAAYLG